MGKTASFWGDIKCCKKLAQQFLAAVAEQSNLQLQSFVKEARGTREEKVHTPKSAVVTAPRQPQQIDSAIDDKWVSALEAKAGQLFLFFSFSIEQFLKVPSTTHFSIR